MSLRLPEKSCLSKIGGTWSIMALISIPIVKNESLQKIKQAELVKLNKLLVKVGKKEIKVISKEEYFKED